MKRSTWILAAVCASLAAGPTLFAASSMDTNAPNSDTAGMSSSGRPDATTTTTTTSSAMSTTTHKHKHHHKKAAVASSSSDMGMTSSDAAPSHDTTTNR